jgi:D-glycero-D-manno-heptose 1,7-bisphosphate phosphatase
MSVPFVILDRDGVINEDSDSFIKSPSEWRAIPRSLEAIAELNRAGFRVVVLTNQSGIARGLFDESTLKRIHDRMCGEIREAGGHVERIFVCPHGPSDGCSCRKPRTGLYRWFARTFGVQLAGLPAVGDSLRDLDAAEAVGASPILVRTGKGDRSLHDRPQLPFPIFPDLYDAAQYIIRRSD